MIRILIRQVIDCWHRAPKSLGVADIEPTADWPLLRGEAVCDYSVRSPFLLSFLLEPLALFCKLPCMLRTFGAWPTQCSCLNIQ